MRKSLVWIVAAALAAGCAQYQQKPLPFQLPASYPNSVEAYGATVAARAFGDPATSKEYFGFDIIGAGVLPVQVIFDHQGSEAIQIVPAQTFLIDQKQNLWNVLDQRLAYDRIEKKTGWGRVAPEAGKGAFLGGAAGAIVGAAIGIVSGRSIPEALGKGAAVGGAAGAVFGGAKGLEDPTVRRSINDDLRNRSLENRPIPPQALSQGVLFFPAEAAGPAKLRLQLKNNQTGETRILELVL
jgi:hypothetical protein